MSDANGKSQDVSLEAKELPQPTKCAHCSRTFPLAVPIVGAPKDTGYIQLTGQLAQHLIQKHPQIAKKAVENQLNMGVGISALMCLQNFESTDEGLLKWRDLIRHNLHRFATKNRISDATIREKVDTLFAEATHAPAAVSKLIGPETVIQLVKDVRDILEERLGYPAESSVISGR
jgi:hypothetical protein